MRLNCAVALFFGVIVVFADLPNHELLPTWNYYLALGWNLAKIAVLVFSGFQLISAEEQISALQTTNERYEKIIADLQNSSL